MAQITVKDLSLGYEGHVVRQNVNFTIEQGDYLCIVGENGSGKSTLMRTILGLQKPLGGTITFGDGLRGNELGYLPQQTQVQRDFPATVWEIVLSGCQARLGLFCFITGFLPSPSMKTLPGPAAPGWMPATCLSPW